MLWEDKQYSIALLFFLVFLSVHKIFTTSHFNANQCKYILFYKNTVYKNQQTQIFQIFKVEFRVRLRLIHFKQIFPNGMLSNYKKVYRNYREELLSMLRFLNIMSGVDHNSTHHVSFLIRDT